MVRTRVEGEGCLGLRLKGLRQSWGFGLGLRLYGLRFGIRGLEVFWGFGVRLERKFSMCGSRGCVEFSAMVFVATRWPIGPAKVATIVGVRHLHHLTLTISRGSLVAFP